MSNHFLGIDTSNYTSSCALYIPESNSFLSKKQLLPVAEGQKGLRQSDAVFHHTKNLPPLLSELLKDNSADISAVSASYAPRDAEGSYMPCFTVGTGYADVLSSSFNAKEYLFSHQSGHVAAALWSSERCDLFGKKFIAFHVSGGTTDVLLVKPCKDRVFDITTVASSLDLKAGQAVDRVGVMLGMKFPSGAELDKLACESSMSYKITPYIRDGSCSLSGIENKSEQMLKNGDKPCDIAKYCIDYIYASLKAMTEYALKTYGNMPIVYAGGVMSNSILSSRLKCEFDGNFAKPYYSSDNAAGTAYLGYIKENMK